MLRNTAARTERVPLYLKPPLRDLLGQMPAEEGEPMTTVLRRLIREEAARRRIPTGTRHEDPCASCHDNPESCCCAGQGGAACA